MASKKILFPIISFLSLYSLAVTTFLTYTLLPSEALIFNFSIAFVTNIVLVWAGYLGFSVFSHHYLNRGLPFESDPTQMIRNHLLASVISLLGVTVLGGIFLASPTAGVTGGQYTYGEGLAVGFVAVIAQGIVTLILSKK